MITRALTAALLLLALLAAGCSDEPTPIVDDSIATTAEDPETGEELVPASSEEETLLSEDDEEIVAAFIDALEAGDQATAEEWANAGAIAFFSPFEPRTVGYQVNDDGTFFITLGPGEIYQCTIVDGFVDGCFDEGVAEGEEEPGDGEDAADQREYVYDDPSFYARVEYLTPDPGGEALTFEGGVVSGEPEDAYVVDVTTCCTGEALYVEVTSLEDNASFYVYGPDGSVLAEDISSVDIALDEVGPYWITVGPTRGNTTYTLRVGVSVSAD